MERQTELNAAKRAGLRWTAGILILLGIWASTAQAGTIVIDDFTQPGPATFFVLGSGLNPVKELSQTASGAIGGQRDLTVSVMGQGKPNSVVGLIGHDTSYNLTALQIGTNGIAPTVTNLLYGSLGVPLATPAAVGETGFVNSHALGAGTGIDLTAGGIDPKFVIEYQGLDCQPKPGMPVTITITSPNGGSSTLTDIAPTSLPTYKFFIPFTKFDGNADYHHVDSISVTFNDQFGDQAPIANVDFAVQLIGVESTTVPEPASATLGAMALAALSWTAWRKRRRC